MCYPSLKGQKYFFSRRRYGTPATKTVLRQGASGQYGDPRYQGQSLSGLQPDFRKPEQQQAYWSSNTTSRQDPYRTPSENEYASIQEATISPGAPDSFSSGYPVGGKPTIPPYTDCDIPGSRPIQHHSLSAQGGVLDMSRHPGIVQEAPGREYYLVDPDSDVVVTTPPVH